MGYINLTPREGTLFFFFFGADSKKWSGLFKKLGISCLAEQLSASQDYALWEFVATFSECVDICERVQSSVLYSLLQPFALCLWGVECQREVHSEELVQKCFLF